MSDLRSKLIRLAHARPELQGQILPLLKQAGAPDLRGLMNDLQALDETLTALEEDFESHYPGEIKVAGDLLSEVKSQVTAVVNAQSGLKNAKEIKERIAAILKAYPEDKTALRAMKDADTMVDRFQRHDEATQKILRVLGKKQMPPALKAYASKLQKAIESKLVDESSLQVIPWASVVNLFVGDRGSSRVEAVMFQAIFRIMLPPPKPSRDDDANDGRYKTPRKVELIIQEATAGSKGPHESYNYGSEKIKDPKELAELFVEQLKGWSGVKGEGDATKKRKATADAIASALQSMVRASRYDDLEKPEVDPSGVSVSVSFRGSIRYEDRGRHDSGEEEARTGYGERMQRALAPYKDAIKSSSVNYGEKGWWSIDVRLK